MNSFQTFEIFELLKSGVSCIDDHKFDSCIFSTEIQELSDVHWTPLKIAIASAKYLACNTPGSTILDIGSGVGKFCIVGSLVTGSTFTGVEVRKNLYQQATGLIQRYGLERLNFLNKHISSIDFTKYSGIYFYNSYAENIFPRNKIDDTLLLNEDNYYYLMQLTKNKLADCPIGTKLVTYCSSIGVVPDNYILKKRNFNNKLHFWQKTA